MIIGVGVDLCRVEPIRRSLDHFGKDWLDEVFTEDEQSHLGRAEQLAQRAAMGFALKEACSKAIGTGFARGVRRQQFVITVLAMGCSVRLTGAAKRRAVELCGAPALVQLHTQVRSTPRWVTALAILQSASSSASFSGFDLLPHLPD
ncbi:MAG TPA: 4'-phosphopantetheinyl transferase superfamily protein [Microvirga sp.]|jgi:holo-[acyl-carrier protein] synthase|nr:4'-phosphopantetheinyl transferase superfamily protein [Microvirga sp.]